MKGNLITLRNVTPEQMSMLAELLLYAYQENGFGFFTPEGHDDLDGIEGMTLNNTPHDLNIWFEPHDVTIQESDNCEMIAFSVLKEENEDPSVDDTIYPSEFSKPR